MMTYVMGEYGTSVCFYLAAALLGISFFPCLKVTETKTVGAVAVH
jgi:hypothetical protein